MKRILTATALTLLFSSVAFGTTIKGSKHDFSSSSAFTGALRSTNQDQICIFCHTPHNAVKNVPLWNRSNPDPTTYKLYTSSATLNEAKGTKSKLYADSISLFCLSCHDGTASNIANLVVNKSAAITGNWNWTTRGGTGSVNTTPANLTADNLSLTNDHPIGFTYPTTDPTLKLQPLANVKTGFGGKTVFFNSNGGANINQMECSSCHAVHDNFAGPFLRTYNTSSALCLTCHNK